ncbi:hypothetical protein GQ55_9G551300 [Panicum hallii var. hallii]|uniref:Uncharacterized protein n=1 Tax=Panicum hallii var. hallii TaxID=1504633 RepID=A0A2T7CFB0_9POAL|nr:hypothetical protein GQ55_9G551300 [Panicum hallii var. hallii]
MEEALPTAGGARPRRARSRRRPRGRRLARALQPCVAGGTLPHARGAWPRGGLGAAGAVRPRGRRLARALQPRSRRSSPASCGACPRVRCGAAGGTLPHAGGACPRGGLGAAGCVRPRGRRLTRALQPHAAGVPHPPVAELAHAAGAASGARRRSQLGVARSAPPHAGGARRRGRLGAPPHVAAGISRCSYPWSRLAQFVATELDSTMRDFDSIAADVDLSLKSWLCRLRSRGSCLHRRGHPQPASNSTISAYCCYSQAALPPC